MNMDNSYYIGRLKIEPIIEKIEGKISYRFILDKPSKVDKYFKLEQSEDIDCVFIFQSEEIFNQIPKLNIGDMVGVRVSEKDKSSIYRVSKFTVLTSKENIPTKNLNKEDSLEDYDLEK